MLRTSRFLLPSGLAAALALAACGGSPAPGPATPSTAPAPSSAAMPATAPVPATSAASPPAIASSAVMPADHAQTRHYKIDINYPRLPSSQAVLSDALHKAGEDAKHEFMQGLPDPQKYPEIADRQMLLKVDFSVASRMPRFVSVREKGMADTGGAHPIPIDGSFVYDTKADRVIELDALFSDPAKARGKLAQVARKSLEENLLAKVPGGSKTSAEARKEWTANMREMIEGGTKPTQENFSEFVVLAGAGDKASGLELIFSPYQVAPYVYGTQTVDVPVEEFSGLLKTSYRDAFAATGSDQ